MILLGEMKGCVVNEGTGPVSQRRTRGVPRVPGQGPAAECRVRALREFCKEAREAREARTTSSPAGRRERTALWEAAPQEWRRFNPDAFLRLGRGSPRWLERVQGAGRVLVGVKSCGVDSGRSARKGTLMP